MRFILIEYARRRKKGKAQPPAAIEDVAGDDALNIAVRVDEDLIALHEALEKFAEADPRAAKVVELRYFGGLTLEETAEVLKVDVTTVKRDWSYAKSWLYSRLN